MVISVVCWHHKTRFWTQNLLWKVPNPFLKSINTLQLKTYTKVKTFIQLYKNICGFEEKLKSMKNLLNLWKPRNLTLYGRITILKSLGLSKLVYNISVLTFPVTFIASVKRTICDFVWNGKPKIKHNTLIGPISKGGLNLPDFEIINNALKVVWIRRLYESKEDASWSHIPLVFIRHLGGPFLFKCNYDLKYLNLNIPIDFYKDTLLIWQTLNQHTPQTKE